MLVLSLLQNSAADSSARKSSYTKAICDGDNYCEDYEVICESGKIAELNPTGYAVRFSANWQDSRSEEDRRIAC